MCRIFNTFKATAMKKRTSIYKSDKGRGIALSISSNKMKIQNVISTTSKNKRPASRTVANQTNK